MITRFLLMFVVFSGVVYYFNIDVRAVVDKSGIPEWLVEHGISAKNTASTTTNAATSTKI